MSTQIHPANPKDGAAISVIMTDWIEETSWMPRVHTEAEYRDFGNWLIEVCKVVVAVVDGRVVGFLAQQEKEIQALYVARRSRNAGIGAELLQYAKASNFELRLWVFQKNLSAQKFYRKHKFEENQRTNGQDNEENLPDIHMVWTRE